MGPSKLFSRTAVHRTNAVPSCERTSFEPRSLPPKTFRYADHVPTTSANVLPRSERYADVPSQKQTPTNSPKDSDEQVRYPRMFRSQTSSFVSGSLVTN